MLFKHKTGKIEEVNEGTGAYSVYMSSPSWSIYKPDTEKTASIYNTMTKKELLEVAEREKVKVYSTWTKTEIIKEIENNKDKKNIMNIVFTDNLLK